MENKYSGAKFRASKMTGDARCLCVLTAHAEIKEGKPSNNCSP